jgi:hypothetical protein
MQPALTVQGYRHTLYLAIKLHCKKFEGNLEEKRLKGKVPLFDEIHE